MQTKEGRGKPEQRVTRLGNNKDGSIINDRNHRKVGRNEGIREGKIEEELENLSSFPPVH